MALLAGCGEDGKWHAIDITGSMRPLAFAMTRAADGRQVTASDYRGSVVLLYFGYTSCPDACPTTLSNIADVLSRLGPEAGQVRVLFVTVDPRRDSAPLLAAYVRNFGRQFVGLRGTADQLQMLARRYRVVYSVSPATADHPYEVTHSSAVFVFDGAGAARLLIPSLTSARPDIAGTAEDLRRLVGRSTPPGIVSRLLRLV